MKRQISMTLEDGELHGFIEREDINHLLSSGWLLKHIVGEGRRTLLIFEAEGETKPLTVYFQLWFKVRGAKGDDWNLPHERPRWDHLADQCGAPGESGDLRVPEMPPVESFLGILEPQPPGETPGDLGDVGECGPEEFFSGTDR